MYMYIYIYTYIYIYVYIYICIYFFGIQACQRPLIPPMVWYAIRTPTFAKASQQPGRLWDPLQMSPVPICGVEPVVPQLQVGIGQRDMSHAFIMSHSMCACCNFSFLFSHNRTMVSKTARLCTAKLRDPLATGRDCQKQ